jgi:hypothetical protein
VPQNSPRKLIDFQQCKTVWQKIRGGLMLGVACIASPCCTPLIVPVVLSLLAGTPFALLLGQNLGWVYGGLTLISALSFVLALRWMRKPTTSQPPTIRLHDISVIVSNIGEKTHAES